MAANAQQQQIVVPDRPHFQSSDSHINLGNIIDMNKLLKITVSNGLKAIPTVGSLLGGLITALWPDPRKPSLRWDEIDGNVRMIVKGLLNDDKVRDLRQRINSLQDLINNYNQTPYGISQKGERFTFILSWLTIIRREFTENGTPWLTLQFFIPMATLHLGFLREQLLHWDQIYPNQPADTDRLRRELRDAITIYTTAADGIRERCLTWRLDERIVVTERKVKSRHRILGSTYHKFVRDLETQFSHEIIWGPEFGPGRGYSPDLEAERYAQDLRDAAGAVYRQQIDDILAPSLQWPQFDREGAYDPINRDIMAGTTGPMGSGISHCMNHFNDREFARKHGRITKVVIHAWARVDGFEIWYGGVSSGLRGMCGGTPRVLEVGEGQSIVCISGRVGVYLDSIRFFLSPETQIQGGQGEDNFRIGFPEDGPGDEPDTFRLQYVYGWSNNSSGYIEGFGAAFHQVEIV
ncbi:uncharacterized protein TRIVIDRAFT_60319 [Trichoderma virens Gv29-8]|uniref:Jacalin-type lectin domain-containing protein n=1 Tax=Hypocrea virens (strain Gv29-8 / FGSC 10586) TaxID=413071 RepID=G9MRZ0_HYPVG|nr:uncharacterized protein TRIVIDRAFT_60319 [Trichoderma virens Gv29-8]EHK22858.1 hypothetical protein TRIVIDRAFT_60319 [Trichoderma virens Gv29-8]